MKIKSLLFLVFLSFNCIASDDVKYLETLDEQASRYRIMCIECVTDAKLSKKNINELDSCKDLYSYTKKGYLDLKNKLVAAEEAAKLEGQSKGLESVELRNKLIVIMSAKSHMSIAGSMLNKVK